MNSEGQAECCISQVLVRVLQINRTNNRERERERDGKNNQQPSPRQSGRISLLLPEVSVLFYSDPQLTR